MVHTGQVSVSQSVSHLWHIKVQYREFTLLMCISLVLTALAIVLGKMQNSQDLCTYYRYLKHTLGGWSDNSFIYSNFIICYFFLLKNKICPFLIIIIWTYPHSPTTDDNVTHLHFTSAVITRMIFGCCRNALGQCFVIMAYRIIYMELII